MIGEEEEEEETQPITLHYHYMIGEEEGTILAEDLGYGVPHL